MKVFIPLVLAFGFFQVGLAAADRAGAADKAFTWLASVKQANGLYDSQADAADVAYTYDEAVAAIAFLVKKDTASANGILNRLKLLQETDGSWDNAYTSTNAIVEGDKGTGPIAWVCMAAAWYKVKTGSSTYDAMAKKALTWLIQYQKSNGGITGGKSASGAALTYTSTEENEDAYAALKYFGDTTEANKVKGFLTTTAWVAASKHWTAGLNDTTIYLDVNTWGVQSLGTLGPSGYAQALDFNMNNLRVTKTANSITVDGFDFNNDKDDIWLEGSGQMAAALYTAGRATDGDHFTDEVIKFQKADGGVPYSMLGGTTGDDGNMTKAEAISATGWLIFAINKFNPFDFSAAPVINPVPAKIIREPSDTTVQIGSKAVFSVSASGDKPILYQWIKQGGVAVVSTDSTFTLASVAASDNNAVFLCIVSNAAGKDTSRAAKLSVPGPGCDSNFTVTPDTVVDEGQSMTLVGTAACATHFQWSVLSGPASKILDPEVSSLIFTAPRVQRDTVLVYRFTADYPTGQSHKDVTVKVREAIPDPLFTLPAALTWDAMLPMIIQPILTNALDLIAARYHPSLVYQWTLLNQLAEATHAGDSLILVNPMQAGKMQVVLCMGNGGSMSCDTTQVTVALTAVSNHSQNIPSDNGGIRFGNVVLSLDGRLQWLAPAYVSVVSLQGRSLWEKPGRPGVTAMLPQAALRELRRRGAYLRVKP